MAVRRALAAAAAGLALAAIASVGAESATTADPALASALQRGGLVLVLRHAATDFSKPDQDPVVLSDRRTQRNLNAQGRADARTISSTIQPLPAPLKANLDGRFWEPGCPVPLSQLRLLTISHWGFDGRVHEGRLVVNRDVAAPLAKVFRRLYELRFPINHMRLDDLYGPRRAHPADGDVSGSFVCREAVPSPCTGGTASGNWSNHAYGHAVDLNPVENPYIGCGRVHDPRSRPYVDRSRLRKGMVTPAVVRAFRSIGWGWGGEWTGQTKDYMHFSTTGH